MTARMGPELLTDDGEVIQVSPGGCIESRYHIEAPNLSGGDVSGANMRLIDAGSVRIAMLTPVFDEHGAHIRIIVTRQP